MVNFQFVLLCSHGDVLNFCLRFTLIEQGQRAVMDDGLNRFVDGAVKEVSVNLGCMRLKVPNLKSGFAVVDLGVRDWFSNRYTL